jgi:hypothetical protein
MFTTPALEHAVPNPLDPGEGRAGDLGQCLCGFLAGTASGMSRGSGSALTGALASVKGYPNSSAFEMGNFALRGLAQSVAGEFSPKGAYFVHFTIDGGIRSVPERWPRQPAVPNAIAETYRRIANQRRSSWTRAVELRPWMEESYAARCWRGKLQIRSCSLAELVVQIRRIVWSGLNH